MHIKQTDVLDVLQQVNIKESSGKYYQNQKEE